MYEGSGTIVGNSVGTVTGAAVGTPTWVAGFVPPPPPAAAPNGPDAQRAGRCGHRDRHVADARRRRVRSRQRAADGDLLRSPVRQWHLRPARPAHGDRLGRPATRRPGRAWAAARRSSGTSRSVTAADHDRPDLDLQHRPSADPVFVGAGDIADCGRTQDEATAAIIGGYRRLVWTAGDNVYPTGIAANFTNCYEPSWGGSIKARTRPVPGNHDWGPQWRDSLPATSATSARTPPTPTARATTATTSPSSNWHVVNLDTECQPVAGGCAAGSAQELWLRADLAANSGKNVIAIWHKPRFSSGVTNLTDLQPFYDDIYEFGVDILLHGHDHIYERLAPMDPSGRGRPDLRHPPVHRRHRRCGAPVMRDPPGDQPGLQRRHLWRDEAHPPRQHLRLAVPADRRERLHRRGHGLRPCAHRRHPTRPPWPSPSVLHAARHGQDRGRPGRPRQRHRRGR